MYAAAFIHTFMASMYALAYFWHSSTLSLFFSISSSSFCTKDGHDRNKKINYMIFIIWSIEYRISISDRPTDRQTDRMTDPYLLLGQLLFKGFAVNGHSMELVLPLFGICYPADEPVIALSVGLHLPAQKVKFLLPQLNLSEHSLPAVLQVAHHLPVVLQLYVTFTVQLRHTVIHRRSPLKLLFQTVKCVLLALRFWAQFLVSRKKERTWTCLWGHVWFELIVGAHSS